MQRVKCEAQKLLQVSVVSSGNQEIPLPILLKCADTTDTDTSVHPLMIKRATINTFSHH